MVELKSCPFCGGKASLNIDPDGVEDTKGRKWAYTISCNHCCATSGMSYSAEKIAESWNTQECNILKVIEKRVVIPSEQGNELEVSYITEHQGNTVVTTYNPTPFLHELGFITRIAIEVEDETH